jgi:hypothetical protein
MSSLIFFVYPDLKGSLENQFTLPGGGVNRLIFRRFEKKAEIPYIHDKLSEMCNFMKFVNTTII